MKWIYEKYQIARSTAIGYIRIWLSSTFLPWHFQLYRIRRKRQHIQQIVIENGKSDIVRNSELARTFALFQFDFHSGQLFPYYCLFPLSPSRTSKLSSATFSCPPRFRGLLLSSASILCLKIEQRTISQFRNISPYWIMMRIYSTALITSLYRIAMK